MPYLNNEVLDDAIILDSSVNFGGGQVSVQRPELIEGNQCAKLDDCSITQLGGIVARRGAWSLTGLAVNGSSASAGIQGLCFFDTDTLPNRLFAVMGGSLYVYTPATAVWTLVSSGVWSTTALVCLVQGNNRLYLADGTQNLREWNSTLTDLGYGGANQPPRGKFIIWFQGRLFMAGIGLPADNTDTLCASDIANVSYWSATFSTRIGAGDGDGITGICPWYDSNIVVGKQNSVYVVTVDPLATSASGWVIRPITRAVGCVSHNSMAQLGNDVLFLSEIGVVSTQRVLNVDNVQIGDALSYPIQDVIDRINWSAASTSCAVAYRGLYVLSIPVDSATTPNVTVVYNSFTKSWSGGISGWTPTAYAVSNFDGLKRLQIGHSNGHVTEWREWVAEANAVYDDYNDKFASVAAYAPTVVTRGFTFGEPLSFKQGLQVVFDVEVYGNYLLEIGYALDGGQAAVLRAFQTVVTPDPAASIALPFDLPDQFGDSITRVAFSLLALPKFRSIQFSITAPADIPGQHFKLRAVSVTAFLETLDVI